MSSLDLLLVDFAGHPFTYQLADDLHSDGERIAYAFCGAVTAPKSAFAGAVEVTAIDEGKSFEKYRPLSRLWHELRFGWGVANASYRLKPRTLVICNMPVISGLVAFGLTWPRRPRRVTWYQDVQSGIAASSLGAVGRVLSWLETLLLRVSSRTIAISDRLAADVRQRGVSPERIAVLPNWAPIEEFPAEPPRSSLFDGRVGPQFLYSGTLARKHDPSLLVDLAAAIRHINGDVIVISEGEGRSWLDAEIAARGIPNLHTHDYQPFDTVPSVLASADVLVVLLDPDAGEFSVPSKVLSYLCAGRPILGAMPTHNAASVTIRDLASAGVVVDPGDRSGFTAAAVELASDGTSRRSMGAAGREYAERSFARSTILTAFRRAVRG